MTWADIVITGANVVTMDEVRPYARAIAVRGERIVAVGDDADIAALCGTRTRRIDAGGRTIVPGLIDGHAHLDREGLRSWYPSLSDCRSIADVQRIVATCASERPAREWIVTSPLGNPPFHFKPASTLLEGRFPNRDDLDAVAPDHPVWIRSIWAYWSATPPYVHVLNSAALRATGIDESTPSPSSSVEIERDAAGRLTGRILESRFTAIAEHTLLRGAPRFTTEIREAALERAMSAALATGTTGVYEGHGVSLDLYGAYRRLHARGAQFVRMTMPLSLPPWSSLPQARQIVADCAGIAAFPGTGDDTLRVSGIFLDYGGDAENASIVAHDWPYTGWAGFLARAIPADEYRELCRTAARHRIRVNSIVGDTLDDILRIWEDVHAETPIDGLRWTLVHARDTDRVRDLPRIRALGAIVTTQVSAYPQRSGTPGVDDSNLKAHRDYIAAGVPWALSSDNKPQDLRQALFGAVTRIDAIHGRTFGAEQRIGVHDALRALTASGAYLCGNEASLGTIVPGKYADFTAFGEDPFTIAPEALRDVPVELTLAGGRIVHDCIG